MEQIPLNFDIPWQENPNIKPDISQFKESENISYIEFINGKWIPFYKQDDAGEMYKR